jgi:CheY-like chemotaxis protein
VTGFNTPKAALTYLSTQPSVDFVLSDMRMPGLSGAELLKTLRASNCSIPFFLMSGHATHEEVNEAYGAGLQGFLSKPFTPRQLAEVVSSIVVDQPLCPE